MTDTNQITKMVFDAIAELNEQMRDEEKLSISSDQDVLFGKGGKLDSIGLVSLIVILEDKIIESFGVPITIADEKAISRKRSPFKTIAALSDYISSLIEEGKNA